MISELQQIAINRAMDKLMDENENLNKQVENLRTDIINRQMRLEEMHGNGTIDAATFGYLALIRDEPPKEGK